MTRHKRHAFSQEQFGERLATAMELNPHAPPKFQGERVWLSEQMTKKGKPIGPETVRKWINGLMMPSHDKIPVLAEILAVDADWLAYGEEAPRRDDKHHDVNAAAAVNLVAGIIQMSGGDAIFPSDKGSPNVDLNAVIRRAIYPLHITVGAKQDDGTVEFLVPPRADDVFVLGVVQREGEFAYDLYELEADKLQSSEIRRGKRVVGVKVSDLRQITSFAESL